jgi:pimeloyl-ACP methyl ester carboxylesterase
MTPFYFGTGSRRLFGIYAPGKAGGRLRAALICPPWGPEYLRAHRSVRQLALNLGAAGFHTLRFDYFGTGDSAGDVRDGDLKGWRADIETALEELKDMTGATQVTVVGLRLGATLAAEVAVRRSKDVSGLVLWDPVVSGADYLRELTTAAAGDPAPVVACPNGREVLGFVLTDRVADEIRQIDLVPLAPRFPPRSLVIVSDAAETSQWPSDAGSADGPRIRLEKVASQPAWVEDLQTGAGAVPVRMLQRIVEWSAQ